MKKQFSNKILNVLKLYVLHYKKLSICSMPRIFGQFQSFFVMNLIFFSSINFFAYTMSFDWKYYTKHNGLKIKSEKKAIEHYQKIGYFEQLPYCQTFNIAILLHLQDISNIDEFLQKINFFLRINDLNNFYIKINIPITEKNLSSQRVFTNYEVEILENKIRKIAPYYKKKISNSNKKLMLQISKYIKNNLSLDKSKIQVLFSENQGHDIGGFFILLDELISQNISHDFIVKLHDYNDANLRKLLTSFLSLKINKLLAKNDVIFSNPIHLDIANKNNKNLRIFLNNLNLPLNSFTYCGGSIFICSSKFTEFYKNKKMALLSHLQDQFPNDLATNSDSVKIEPINILPSAEVTTIQNIINNQTANTLTNTTIKPNTDDLSDTNQPATENNLSNTNNLLNTNELENIVESNASNTHSEELNDKIDIPNDQQEKEVLADTNESDITILPNTEMVVVDETTSNEQPILDELPEINQLDQPKDTNDINVADNTSYENSTEELDNKDQIYKNNINKNDNYNLYEFLFGYIFKHLNLKTKTIDYCPFPYTYDNKLFNFNEKINVKYARKLIKKNNIKVMALYFPQFHEFEENNKHWGKGFTEWTLMNKYKGEIKKPHIDIGQYNILDYSTRKKQAKIAKEHGIDSFCYYHYWFKDKPVMNAAIDKILEDGEPNIPFIFCWVNVSWTNTWTSPTKNSKILIKQEYGNEKTWLSHYNYLSKFFKHKNYIKENNCPIIAIWDMISLSQNKAISMINFWKECAKKDGFSDLKIIAICGKHLGNPNFENAYAEHQPNFNSKFSKGLFYNGNQRNDNVATIYDSITRRPKIGNCYYRGIFFSFDNSSRRVNVLARKYINLSYNLFAYLIYRQILNISYAPNKTDNYLFLNSWNEWTEQAMVEPNEYDGYEILKVIKQFFG